MGLLNDLYNTLAKFFRSQDSSEEDASKSVATSRLKLVLMQDRTNLTPKILEQMRGELVDLLSKYLEMDKELLELNFEQEGDQVALMLSIPVIRAKDEEEIEAALAAQKQETEEASGSDEETDEETDEITDEEVTEASDEESSADTEEDDSDDEIVSEAEDSQKKSNKKKYVDPADMKKDTAEKDLTEEKVSEEV